LGIICVVLGGGTYAASRWFSSSSDGTTVPGVIIDDPGATPTNESIFGQPTQPELPLNPAATTVSGNTPFTTIEGFPNDIPLLTDNNGDLSKTTSQGMNIYTFSTNMPYDQIVEFFKSGMAQNGWTVLSETTQAGQQSWNFTKGQDQNRMVMINLIGEGDVSQISIMEIAQ